MICLAQHKARWNEKLYTTQSYKPYGHHHGNAILPYELFIMDLLHKRSNIYTVLADIYKVRKLSSYHSLKNFLFWKLVLQLVDCFRCHLCAWDYVHMKWRSTHNFHVSCSIVLKLIIYCFQKPIFLFFLMILTIKSGSYTIHFSIFQLNCLYALKLRGNLRPNLNRWENS